MKGVTLLKPNKAMSELDYNDHREHRGQVGTGRKYRRMFWKAHRRECTKIVAEQLNDNGPTEHEAHYDKMCNEFNKVHVALHSSLLTDSERSALIDKQDMLADQIFWHEDYCL